MGPEIFPEIVSRLEPEKGKIKTMIYVIIGLDCD